MIQLRCTVIYLMMLWLLAISANCQQTGSSKQETCAIQISDDLHQSIKLNNPATRIVSLSPSNTEILFALGCGARVVLRDTTSDFPPQAHQLPATNPFQLSPEHVAGFSPDLVIVSQTDPLKLRALQNLGLTVASFIPRNIDDIFRSIQAIGYLCGAQHRAQPLIEKLKKRVYRVARAVRGRPHPKVYIETDGSNPQKPWTAGPGSFVDQVVQLAGGQNHMAGIKQPYAQISAEELLLRQPEVILLMNVENHSGTPPKRSGLARLKARPGWLALSAVQKERVIESIPADLLSRPGPRLIDGLEKLARALHPEAFRP
jgi:iron complex transport system substrate-binding protein